VRTCGVFWAYADAANTESASQRWLNREPMFPHQQRPRHTDARFH
jgi:hypothetical protein